MKEYRLRAHHGMCLAFFEGKGYSEEFGMHMSRIKSDLKNNPNVKVVCEIDDICSKCPNNKKGKCLSEEKVKEYDREVLKRCNLSEGKTISYDEFKNLVYKNVLIPEKREEICGNCQWNELCYFKKY